VAEFRRFTNALAKRGASTKWWLFSADRRAGILHVAVNVANDPTKAEALEALVRDWRGEVHLYE
jgi:hypothetical protein